MNTMATSRQDQPLPAKSRVVAAISTGASETRNVLCKYAQFIGPGFLISVRDQALSSLLKLNASKVAYIDPGNYATDVAAGASSRYSLLFVVFMANLFAVFLQSLCIKLGTVTGFNLAEMCRIHLPRYLTIILYVFSEAAIIATDVAEVGSD